MRPFPVEVDLNTTAGQNSSKLVDINGSLLGVSASWVSGTDPICYLELWVGAQKITHNPLHIAHFANHKTGGQTDRIQWFPVASPPIRTAINVVAHNVDVIDGNFKIVLWIWANDNG